LKRLTFVLAAAATLAVLPAYASANAPRIAPWSAPRASIPGLVTPGTITFGTNFGYPPMEYFAGQGGAIQTGADVEIGQGIVSRLHLKAFFFNVTDFGVIITGLTVSHRWDVILSSLNETPARAKVLNFVPYMNVGQSILVRKGNPENIHVLADLSGKSVAAQVNTVEVDSVRIENKTLLARHKAPITLATFPEDTTATQGLATGRFDAVLDDYPVAVYDAKVRPTIFQVTGQQFGATPYAMAFRKSDTTLLSAVAGALQAMRKDGSYAKILKKYNLSQAAY